MDSNNWRTALPQDSRNRIVKRIMDTLQRHMSPTGTDSMGELLKIALRFEEKIFQAATDQQDYLRKISLKMLSLETKAQATPASNMARQGVQQGVQGGMKLLDLALLMNQAQGLGNGLQMPGLVGGQAQQRQQVSGQPLQSNMNANVLQNATGLGQSISSMSGMPQSNLTTNQGPSSRHPNTFLNAQRLQQQIQQQRQQQQQPPSVHQQQLIYQRVQHQQQAGGGFVLDHHDIV